MTFLMWYLLTVIVVGLVNEREYLPPVLEELFFGMDVKEIFMDALECGCDMVDLVVWKLRPVFWGMVAVVLASLLAGVIYLVVDFVTAQLLTLLT